MIISAHLGHWYSAFGFLLPAVLVVMWIRFQARRERRRQEFCQYWTLELRAGRWEVVEIQPAPGSRRQRRARLQLTSPPWSAPTEGKGDAQTTGESIAAKAGVRAAGNGQSASNGHSSASNGHSR